MERFSGLSVEKKSIFFPTKLRCRRAFPLKLDRLLTWRSKVWPSRWGWWLGSVASFRSSCRAGQKWRWLSLLSRKFGDWSTRFKRSPLTIERFSPQGGLVLSHNSTTIGGVWSPSLFKLFVMVSTCFTCDGADLFVPTTVIGASLPRPSRSRSHASLLFSPSSTTFLGIFDRGPGCSGSSSVW